MSRKPDLLLSLSGGMDSATLLGVAIEQGHYPSIAHFQYGSKHNRFEQQAVEALCYHYRGRIHNRHMFNLETTFSHFNSNLLKSGGAIPEGHYQQSNMSQTVVPGRNLIFLSILAGLAESSKIPLIWIGAHSGDHVIYPDCRPDFIYAVQDTVKFSSDGAVSISAPFLKGNKTTLLEAGLPIKVPYHLTRTCYKHQAKSCGVCGACQERLEAFAAVGVADPIDYDSRDILPKPTE